MGRGGRGELIGRSLRYFSKAAASMLQNITCYVTNLKIIVLVLAITIVGDHKTSKVSLRKDS